MLYLGKSSLVSLGAYVSISQLKTAIYGPDAVKEVGGEALKQCQIVRVTPSTASAVRASYTLIVEENDEHYPPSAIHPVYSLFMRVGSVKLWPDSLSSAGAT